MKKKISYADYMEDKDIGLFTRINEINEFPWNDVYTPEELDILFLFKHGDKPLIKSLYSISIDTLAKIVYTSYSVKWEKLFEGLTLDTPLNEKYRLTVDETISSDDEINITGEALDKESAFNNDNLVTSGGNENTSLTENKLNRERVTDQSRVDRETLENSIKFLEENLFVDTVLNDVSELINLKIYS